MAGKEYAGATSTAKVKESRAYCEGRAASIASATRYSTGTTGAEGDNNGLTYTAVYPGQGAKVNLLDPGEAGSALSVSTSGLTVNVSLKTPEAAAFETGVEGNDNGITWTPDENGDGQVIVNLIDPEGNDEELAVSVSGYTVNVSLATGGAGAITSTAAEVIAAVAADDDAAALVAGDNTGASDGSAAVVEESGSSGVPDSTAAEVDAAIDASAAAAAIVTPANTGASNGTGAVVAESVTLTGSAFDGSQNSDDAVAWNAGYASNGGGTAWDQDNCPDLGSESVG